MTEAQWVRVPLKDPSMSLPKAEARNAAWLQVCVRQPPPSPPRRCLCHPEVFHPRVAEAERRV